MPSASSWTMKVHINTVAGNEVLVLDATGRYPQFGAFGLNPGLIKTNIHATTSARAASSTAWPR